MNLAQTILNHALTRADHPAIVQKDQTLTYRDLELAVDAFANRLKAAGVRPGDAIGVCLQDRPIHLIGIVAILKLGAIVLPMDWRWTLVEQSKIAKRFDAKLMLVEPNRPHPTDVNVVPIEADIKTRLATISPIPAHDSTDSPAILGLSSGTTGEPKAIVTTHAQYAARLDAFTRACDLRADDRYASTLPLVFSAGRLFALAHLAAGATILLMPSFSSPAEIAREIIETKATSTCLVPMVSRAMLATRPDDNLLFPDLRLLMSIGAPLHDNDRTLIKQRLCPNLIDLYASTGGSLATAIGPREQELHPGSVGRTAEQVELQIVDDADHPLPVGEVGRVRYRGPGMPMGFYKGVAPGDEDFRDGWFYPGDYGSIDADGYLYLHGRRSEIVIRGGINVYTPEIERALLSHLQIKEAAVIGVSSKETGEEVVAFVVCESSLETRQIIQHCRGVLAPYKIPTRFHRVESLPRNTAGKVFKSELVRMDAGLHIS